MSQLINWNSKNLNFTISRIFNSHKCEIHYSKINYLPPISGDANHLFRVFRKRIAKRCFVITDGSNSIQMERRRNEKYIRALASSIYLFIGIGLSLLFSRFLAKDSLRSINDLKEALATIKI
jgi:hypothetical protein